MKQRLIKMLVVWLGIVVVIGWQGSSTLLPVQASLPWSTWRGDPNRTGVSTLSATITEPQHTDFLQLQNSAGQKIYANDTDHDGTDEVFVIHGQKISSYTASGVVRWEAQRRLLRIERFADINGDGVDEIIALRSAYIGWGEVAISSSVC